MDINHTHTTRTHHKKAALIFAMGLLAWGLVACEDPKPASDAPETPTPTTSATPQPETSKAIQTPPPKLSGFFKPGNFATMTVPSPTPEQKPQSLSIKSLDVVVAVQGRLARTQVTQVFHNHTPRQTEGTYTFTLPEGASISRLAMDVEGTLMEGELVERERARMIYEGIVRRQKDPALLEWQGGNRFKTQIFPIAANGDKTVILSYEQLLPAAGREARYTYALPRLEGEDAGQIGTFTFRLHAHNAGDIRVEGYDKVLVKGASATMHAEPFSPNGPLDVIFTTLTPQTQTGYGHWKNERFFVLDYVPKLPTQKSREPHDVVMVIDTSAGIGSKELKRVRDAVQRLLGSLPDGAQFRVLQGDTTTQWCNDAPTTKTDLPQTLTCMNSRSAGGATDLSQLLNTSLSAATTTNRPTSVVLFTDGVASVGELDADLLHASIPAQLSTAPVSLHTVAVGLSPNSDFLTTLARVGRGHSFRMSPVSPVAAVVESLQHTIAQPLMTNIRVSASRGKVEGLVPHHSFNLARGQRQTIMGRLDEGIATITVEGTYDGAPITQTFQVKTPVSLPRRKEDLLSNFWARAVIKDMQRGDANRDKIVQTSLHYGVMSRYTSFLVLENDEAYKRFKVERHQEAEKNRLKEAAKKQEKTAARQSQKRTKEDPDDDIPQHNRNLTKSAADLKEILDSIPAEPPEAKPIAEPEPDSVRVANKRPAFNMEKFKWDRSQSAARASDNKTSLKSSGTLDGGGRRLDSLAGGAERKSLDEVFQGNIKKDDGEHHFKRNPTAGESPKVKVHIGRRTVQGAVVHEYFDRVIRKKFSALSSCYQKNLHTLSKTTPGQISLKFTLNSSGHIIRIARTNNTTRNLRLATCVISQIKRLKFPRTNNGATATYELIFTPDTLHKAIKKLEKLKTRHSNQNNRLFRLYVNTGQRAKAKKQLEHIRASLSEDERPKRLYQLGASRQARALLKDEFFSIMREAIAHDPSKRSVVQTMFNLLTETKRWNRIPEELGKTKPALYQANEILTILLHRLNRIKEANALLDAWLDRMSPEEGYQLLTHNAAFAKRYPTRLFRTTGALLAIKDTVIHDVRPDIMDHRVSASKACNKTKKALPDVIARCKNITDEREHCERWLGELSDLEPAQKLLREVYYPDIIKTLRQQRSQDMANPDLILQLANRLRQSGETRQSRRVLSELVEFTPHGFTARMNYANALEAQGRTEQACAQMAQAVQLNPSERDTFKKMMLLRRKHTNKTSALLQCITDGVSKLPVQRAVSIVMTWEDSSADVDLHITEADGVHVSFEERESDKGGLLYYDITDGFGPEIYVLGSGPIGLYHLNVVYYSGTRQNLRGTVTILRNAGAPSETREERPFTLRNPNQEKRVPLGSFRL